ncbi:MAG: hypothetical protein R3B48_10890 [Kofleriaceae bacterium]
MALVLVAVPSLAEARRRIVILDFEGPKAEQFRVDVERIVKKSHMVIPVAKWNAAAEEMDATGLSERDVKKVAKRLNVDGVISGKVEKRRDEYILRLKVREGKTGEVIGNPIDTKTGGARLDGSATREIKSELFDTLDILDTGGGDESEEAEEDEESAPTRRFVKRKSADDEEEEDSKPTKGKKGKKGKVEEDEEEEEEVAAKPTKGKKGKKGKVEEDEEEEEDEEVAAKPTKGKKEPAPVEVAAKPTKDKKEPAPVEVAAKPTKDKKEPAPVEVAAKPTKDKKDKKEPSLAMKKEDTRVASASKKKPKKKKKNKPKKVEEDLEVEEDEELVASYEPLDDGTAMNHAHRAVDAIAGLSFTVRRLRYKTRGIAAPATPPRKYDSVPVAGLNLDAEFYPLAYGHTRSGVLTNLGVTAMFDRALIIRTRLRYTDPGTGAAREKELRSTYQRFAIGAIYRHNLGTPERPLVVTGSLRYGGQKFTVDRGDVAAEIVDIPAVKYAMFEPAAGIRYHLTPKMAVGAEASTLLMLSTGEIQEDDQYGAATVTAFEFGTFFDYMITDKIFARAAGHVETIGIKFKGFGMLSTMRDGDADQDVMSARDTYFGGAVTAGYVF